MLSPQKKEELKKNWLRFHNRSLYEPEKYADYWLSKFDQLLDEELSSYTQGIRDAINEIKISSDRPENNGVADIYSSFWEETLKPKVLQILESNE